MVVVIAGTARRNEFTVTAQYADRTADRGGGGKGTILGEDGAKDGGEGGDIEQGTARALEWEGIEPLNTQLTKCIRTSSFWSLSESSVSRLRISRSPTFQRAK